MITDSASSTNRPPTSASRISCLASTATLPMRAAERERADVAHEDLGRMGVAPQEAERRADQRAAEHRHLADARHVGHLQVARRRRELPAT